jgi:hypothetical protein
MKKAILGCVIGLGLFTAYNAFTGVQNSSGRTGYTGSPGETTCSSCHSGGSGTGNVNVTGNFITPGNFYVNGQTYNMSVVITDPTASRYGFGLEALDTNNVSIGTLTAGSGSQVQNAPNGRQNIIHTNGGSTSSNGTFNFTWTAPPAYAGRVKFYVAANAANGNGSDSGDKIYTDTLSVFTSGPTQLANSILPQIGISPNPVIQGNTARIQLQSGAYALEVLDLSGKVMIRAKAADHAGIYELPTQLLTTGIYYIRLEQEGKVSSSRIWVR